MERLRGKPPDFFLYARTPEDVVSPVGDILAEVEEIFHSFLR